MEYEFLQDATTGNTKAKFSLDHEIFGPWLEIEVGSELSKVTQLLQSLSDVCADHTKQAIITGHEYSILMNHTDVIVKANMSMNGEEHLPIELMGDDLSFEYLEEGQCSLEEFRELLLSWSAFNNG